jgi:asparagine synthase (glutamine-hydrolysing)
MGVLAGILRFDDAPAERVWLDKTSAILKEYGPDGECIHMDGSFALLYRPFHTTPESRGECHPFIFGGGKVITWDGRLDNRDELICKVSAPKKHESSDMEIVAEAFERWGTDCFNKIIGDWSLSIWDPREKTLILARDYIGVRQLFYYVKSDAVRWCNNLAALTQGGDSLQICDEYIAGYLAFKPDAHLTPFSGIRSVPPGTFVLIKGSRKITPQRFWEFNPWRNTRYKSDAEYEERYFQLFRQSVRRRLRTDAPILSALSGGLDSSSIVCMADDIHSKGETGNRVDTVSYYDLSEPDEDDSYHLAKVEARRERKGFHLHLSRSEDCLSFEYPEFIPRPGFAMRAEIKSGMSTLVRKGRYRVMLSGTGGDEMNGQALSISVAIAKQLAGFHFYDAGRQLIAWSKLTRRPLIQLLCSALLELSPLRIRARFASRGRLQSWVDPKFARKYRISARQIEDLPGIWFWRPGPRDAAQTIMTLARELTFCLPSPIEQRYPYLDQDLVEFLTSIPFDQLLRPGSRRNLMRRALSDLLPPEVLIRKTKASAKRCYALALQKHWAGVEEVLRRPMISALGYVDGHGLRSDLIQVRNGRIPEYLVRLLKALSLELWLRDIANRNLVAFSHRVSFPAQAFHEPSRYEEIAR